MVQLKTMLKVEFPSLCITVVHFLCDFHDYLHQLWSGDTAVMKHSTDGSGWVMLHPFLDALLTFELMPSINAVMPLTPFSQHKPTTCSDNIHLSKGIEIN